MPGYRDAARSIDQVKYRENYDKIFGKRESILDKAPKLPTRKRNKLKGNSVGRTYFFNK